MCIHEQLETLHDTMSAHMKTYKMWMSSKTILRNVLYSSSKQDLKRIKGNYLEVFLSIIPFFERTEFWIYNTIEVTSQNRGDRTTAVRHPHLLWDQKKKKGKKKKLCSVVTLGFLEQLAWYFPTGLCFPGSGTGPGLRTCPLEWSHRRQSSAHWLAPAGAKMWHETVSVSGKQDKARKVWLNQR